MFDTKIGAAGIPKGLDTILAGPHLGAILSSIDVEQLSGRDAVEFARAQHRQVAHDQSREYRALSRVSDLYPDDFAEFAPAEIGAALTYTRSTADREMAIAFDLAHRYPALLEMFECGRIDQAKVRLIVNGVGHVDTAAANAAIARILPQAPDLTTGQIAIRLRRIVIEIDPDQANQALETAKAAADVWSCLESDGSGTLIARGMDPYDLSRANHNINGIARHRKSEGDSRPIGIIRSEVFAGLLAGEISSTSKKAQVNITGDLSTLAGLDERAGDLDGFGPVLSDILRQIVSEQHDSTWSYELLDEETGEMYVGTTSRRPTVDQKRKIVARYRTCIHPTCRMPATQCDIDHTEDWSVGGLTTLCNLAPLCRYHHRLKHLTAWSYRKLARGSIEWVSQFGIRYLTHPP